MARLEQLITGIQLGDGKPSHMLALLQRTDVTNDMQLIKQLWIQRLPMSVRAVVACVAKSNPNYPLDELGAMADEIFDSTHNSSVESVTSPTNNNSAVDAVSNDISERISQIEKTLSSLQKDIKRSSSSSRRNNSPQNTSFCYFHKRFGNRARKCNPPCNFVVSKN